MMDKEELIDKLSNNEISLSFSALKEFAKSPQHFINYKLGDKPQTAAMKKGSIVHCAILEPEQLEKRYSILNKSDLPNPEKDFRDTANKQFKSEFEANCIKEGKEIIDPSEWENACKHRDIAYNNEVISPYLTKLVQVETPVTFDIEEFRFRGVIDGLAKTFELDLKTVADASPDRIKWTYRDGKFNWQHWLYKQSPAVKPYFDQFNLLIDAKLGMSLLHMTFVELAQAEAEIMVLLEKFRLCRDQNLWHQNYEFWAGEKGYFEID